MSRRNKFNMLKGYSGYYDNDIVFAVENYLKAMAILSKRQKTVSMEEMGAYLNTDKEQVKRLTEFLKKEAFLHIEKNNSITLTLRGKELGEHYLYRHEVIHKFLCWLGNKEYSWEDAEKLESLLSDGMFQMVEKYSKENQIMSLPEVRLH